MSGYWSFRDPAAAAPAPSSANMQVSMSAQVLPYGREIALESQSAALAAYPWVHTGTDLECGSEDADVAAVEADAAAMTYATDTPQVTPWKFFSSQASPLSEHTRERQDAYTEEDITLIEMDAEEDDDNLAEDETTTVRVAAPAVARQLPFEVHCARDLAVEETQSAWWQQAMAAHRTADDRDEAPLLETVVAAAAAADPPAGSAVEALKSAVAPATDEARLIDDEDRHALAQMLAPHRAAPAGRRSSGSARGGPPRPEASRPGVEGVVGRAQPLVGRPRVPSQHADPQAQSGDLPPPPPPPERVSSQRTVDGNTLVARMAQRAAARLAAREALKQQQAAHAAALVAQHVDHRQQVMQAHKSADGRPAFTLYGMRCGTEVDATKAKPKPKPKASTTMAATAAQHPARLRSTSARMNKAAPAVSGGRPSSLPRRPPRAETAITASAPPCRARITPLTDKAEHASARSSATPSKTPRRVRFADDDEAVRTEDGADVDHQKSLSHGDHARVHEFQPVEVLNHVVPEVARVLPPAAPVRTTTACFVAEVDATDVDPIPFHELATLMLAERQAAMDHHDTAAAATIEMETALLASDYHALRLTTMALHAWRRRAAQRRYQTPLRGQVADTRGGVPPSMALPAAGKDGPLLSGMSAASPWEPDTFPASPLIAAGYSLMCAEADARARLVRDEAEAFAAHTQRHRRLAIALDTLLARTQQRQRQTLRWCFVAWVSLEETHRTERLARQYREHLMACARQTLAGMGLSSTY